MLYIGVNLLLTWLATWVQKKFVGEKKILEVSMVGEAPKSVATRNTLLSTSAFLLEVTVP